MTTAMTTDWMRIWRATLVLGALLLGAVLLRDVAWHAVTPVTAIGARCDQPEALLEGEIRYDSGASLHYCDLGGMLAQLSAQEQGDLVRTVYVRTVNGRWLPAQKALYARLQDGQGWQAYVPGQQAPEGATLMDYHQVLLGCAAVDCASGQ